SIGFLINLIIRFALINERGDWAFYLLGVLAGGGNDLLSMKSGVYSYTSITIIPFLNGLLPLWMSQQPDKKFMNDPNYKSLVETILERTSAGYPMIASRNMLDRLLNVKFTECFPTVFDHVDNDGKMYWPCKSYPKALKLNVLDFKNIKQAHGHATTIICYNNY
ncbi:MAG: hypothetical protein ACTSVI_15520, partial [Promethearchaeota archaeon]